MIGMAKAGNGSHCFVHDVSDHLQAKVLQLLKGLSSLSLSLYLFYPLPLFPSSLLLLVLLFYFLLLFLFCSFRLFFCLFIIMIAAMGTYYTNVQVEIQLEDGSLAPSFEMKSSDTNFVSLIFIIITILLFVLLLFWLMIDCSYLYSYHSKIDNFECEREE